jgi:hypothetical protein
MLGDAVVGGYHDAGDHIKHALTTAQSVVFLAWSALDFQAGHAAGERRSWLGKLLGARCWGSSSSSRARQNSKGRQGAAASSGCSRPAQPSQLALEGGCQQG